MDIIHLKNGADLIAEPMMNTHSVTIGLYVRSGTIYENNCNNGITHLLEHMHFRELSNMSQDELYYNMESIGSTLRAATYYDFLKYTMKVRPKYLKECINIFAQIVSTYSWSEDCFKKEKEVIKRQIEERESDFSSELIIRKELFGDCNLANSIMGSKENMDRISLSELLLFKKAVFNSINMIFCITGFISDADLKLILSNFESLDIKSGEKLKCSDLNNQLFCRKPNIAFYDDNWSTLDVNISFDIDYSVADIDELKIINCILGEGVGSRLQKSIREELNYTSNIRSETEIYENFAVLHIKFSICKKQLLDCLAKVFSIVIEMKYNINRKDLAVSLPFYSDNQDFLNDDTELMNFELAYNYFILNRHSLKTSVTNSQEWITRLSDVAKGIFISKNTSVVVFGNCKGITEKSIKDIVGKLDS